MISSTRSHIQNNGLKRSRKMPFSRKGSALLTSTPRREHKRCVGLFIQMIQQNSAAASLGSVSSLLLGQKTWTLLHLYESTNMFLFQYSWRQEGIKGIKSCLSTYVTRAHKGNHTETSEMSSQQHRRHTAAAGNIEGFHFILGKGITGAHP